MERSVPRPQSDGTAPAGDGIVVRERPLIERPKLAGDSRAGTGDRFNWRRSTGAARLDRSRERCGQRSGFFVDDSKGNPIDDATEHDRPQPIVFTEQPAIDEQEQRLVFEQELIGEPIELIESVQNPGDKPPQLLIQL